MKYRLLGVLLILFGFNSNAAILFDGRFESGVVYPLTYGTVDSFIDWKYISDADGFLEFSIGSDDDDIGDCIVALDCLDVNGKPKVFNGYIDFMLTDKDPMVKWGELPAVGLAYSPSVQISNGQGEINELKLQGNGTINGLDPELDYWFYGQEIGKVYPNACRFESKVNITVE